MCAGCCAPRVSQPSGTVVLLSLLCSAEEGIASHAYLETRCARSRLGWVGLEPTTNALKGRCSTIELPTHGEFPL